MPRRRKDKLPAEAGATIHAARAAARAVRRKMRPPSQHAAALNAFRRGDAKGALDVIRAWRALLAASRETEGFRNFVRGERESAAFRRGRQSQEVPWSAGRKGRIAGFSQIRRDQR